MKRLLPLLLIAFAVGGCVSLRDRTRHANAAIIQRYFDRWANQGDTAVADALIATNVALHHPSTVLRSLEEYKRSMAGFHAAFPDLHFSIEDEIIAGDKVAVRWTLRGTHCGEFQGHRPTEKRIRVTGMSWFRIEQGRIQEIWVHMDRFGLLDQLGWISVSAPPASEPAFQSK